MIAIKNLRFNYPGSSFGLHIPDWGLPKGARMVVVGPSGAGKTTLLNLIAGLLRPEQGHITIDGVDLTRFPERDIQDFRIARMGLIFQEFELLHYLDVRQNILLPYRLNPIMRLDQAARDRAESLAEKVGLGDKLRRLPKQLSQGERQRVAVCRALVAEPALLLCDEPTGNLDPRNRDQVLDILFAHCDKREIPLLFVTHDQELLPRFSDRLDIRTFQA